MAPQPHPDQMPSTSDYWYVDADSTRLFLEVSGAGVMVFRCGTVEGEWQFHGVSLVTKDEIYFD